MKAYFTLLIALLAMSCVYSIPVGNTQLCHHSTTPASIPNVPPSSAAADNQASSGSITARRPRFFAQQRRFTKIPPFVAESHHTRSF
uniref:Secreted protein n=1 Tax=Panagrellus redivivus TaxID=6233 RepID=A0A7E4UTJ9_PANRE